MNTTIQIQNLKYGGCEEIILQQLSKIEGVDHVQVVVELSEVRFKYDNEIVLEKVYKKLNDLGYPVLGAINTLSKKAKSY